MIGNVALTLALLSAVFSVIMYFLNYRGYKNTLGPARISFHISAIMVLVASALLLQAILTHQYQYRYVYNYSGSGLPLGLLMSTFYAGQEGSFMLWTLFSSIVGLILLDYTSKRGDLEQRVMMVYGICVIYLLVMVNPLLKSPFIYIWSQPDFIDLKHINSAYLTLPALQNFLFSDPQSGKQFIQIGPDLLAILKANNVPLDKFIIEGKGLNPLLQNFWMQIHPPMLFVGFSMAAVPYSFAMAALIKNEYNEWVKQSLPWLLIGTMVLGLAIMLGGYWAYGVLGWGGYWGWDPVENSSLVPWLIAVATIHTMLIQKKTQDKSNNDKLNAGRFVKTNLILSIFVYILVLYSTFLTRSGILGDASVHSFVDPGMMVYLLLLVFLLFFGLLGLGLVFYRWKYLTENFSYEENILSRELALFTGSFALIASAIIILVGTSAPIFGQTVELKFYNELNLPIAIIIGFLNGLSIILKWKTTGKEELLKGIRMPLVISFLLTAAIFLISGVENFMLVILTFSSIFAIVINGEIVVKILRGKKNHAGAYIAHIGIAIFMVGVAATAGYTKSEQVDLVKGEKVELWDYQLSFAGYQPIEGGKKYAFNVEIKDGDDIKVAAPIMYIAEFNNSLMREPDILVGLTKDFYVAPVSYDEENPSDGGETINMKKGDVIDYRGMKIEFTNFILPEDMTAMMSGGKFKIGANLRVTYNGKTFNLEPYMESASGQQEFHNAELKEADLKIALANMNATGGEITIVLQPLSSENIPIQTPKEVLTVEVSIKPFISLVWLGVVVMVIGFIISASRRSKESLA
ncbi:cytochrome c-type biogenesis CcmF C-terminal domain-containing protein [Melioribacter sp. OK-6-Me]|uniref:cytochrome c-type biogenesis CcmF C-terminal domain-containing protein n=1 Tax=unclassified Melioribacter TaxID=2627329 RepID=UPI003ED8E4B9